MLREHDTWVFWTCNVFQTYLAAPNVMLDPKQSFVNMSNLADFEASAHPDGSGRVGLDL